MSSELSPPITQLQLPEGVGRIYYGGQRVVVDYHYFNPTPDPIPARHAINLHQVEEQDVQHVAQTWGFYNFLVFALPGQEAQTAAACTFNDDVVLHSLTRHTHRWGTDFHIWHEGGEKDGQHLWSSESWETEVDYVFEEPLFVPAGEGSRSSANTTTPRIQFSPLASRPPMRCASSSGSRGRLTG